MQLHRILSELAHDLTRPLYKLLKSEMKWPAETLTQKGAGEMDQRCLPFGLRRLRSRFEGSVHARFVYRKGQLVRRGYI